LGTPGLIELTPSIERNCLLPNTRMNSQAVFVTTSTEIVLLHQEHLTASGRLNIAKKL